MLDRSFFNGQSDNSDNFHRKGRVNVLRRLARAAGMLSINVGVDPRRFGNVRHLARYSRNLRTFKAMRGTVTSLFPILSDFDEQAGAASGQYFHQDLLVARAIFEANPRRHIDVASRVDGFVAHVAAFRDIEVLDIRPLESVGHPSISFVQADLMQSETAGIGTADSVSCLHALEHFGLGRYGDPIDPAGHVRGFRHVLQLVALGGRLYIGVPIGSEAKVEFDAHRIFTPTEALGWAPAEVSLTLLSFSYVDDAGTLVRDADPYAMPPLRHGCGIYTFQRGSD